MSAVSGEVLGLDQCIAYAQHLAGQAGAHSSDAGQGYLARLAASRVTRAGLATARAMQAAFTAASAAAGSHAGELAKQINVQEAYDQAGDAGDKQYLTGSAAAAAEPAPPHTPAAAAASAGAGCVFCAIVAGQSPASVVRRWDDVIAIRPRHPVVPGHVLVIPHAHVADVGDNPAVSARTMVCAAQLAGELDSANVLTSKGRAATQTVFHLHLHVVPRVDADGLPLPWTPQHAAQRLAARHTTAPTGGGGVNVVWAREPIPAEPSVFLAGPTPRTGSVPSWRPAAIAALAAAWAGPGPLTVLTPESRGGQRAKEYHDQVEWEAAGLDAATAILFWIPRDLHTLPGFTTNVEFGLYAGSGRVVLGAPPDCPNPERNRYLAWTARRFGVPVYPTLAETVAGALGLITGGTR